MYYQSRIFGIIGHHCKEEDENMIKSTIIIMLYKANVFKIIITMELEKSYHPY